MLFLATTINYLDRQVLAQLKPVLDVELGWSNEQFGRVNSLFQGAYALSLLLFGALVDRVGTKVGYAVSIVAWSGAAVGHALVGGIGGLSVARVALGLGEGGNFPSAIKTVALWFPVRERALATGLFNAGSNVGAIIAAPLTAWIVVAWGWRAAFVVVGVAGFAWLGGWLAFYRAPIAGTEGPRRRVGWGRLLRHRQTWSFIVGKLLTDPVWWFYLAWLPDFFKKTRGLNIQQSVGHIVAIYAAVTVLSVLAGWFTGHLAGRGHSVTRARKTGLLLAALCALPVMRATGASAWLTVPLIALAMAAHQAWSVTLYTTVSDMFPGYAVASVTGLGGMAGSVGGMVGHLAAGVVLDRFTAAGDVTAGYTLLFSVCGGLYLVAFALHHLLAPRLEPIPLRAG